MARISDNLIQEVLQKTEIVDLISEKVALSKHGKSYFGLCPFHNEKTPSFSVDPERGIYNCFSCGEKGNAITFKQNTENLTFVEAIEDLAIRANIDYDFSSYQKVDPNKHLYQINLDAKNFYKLYLSSTKPGQLAKEYLHKRHITDEIIQQFEFGLAPSEFDLLHKTLTAKDYLPTDLYDLGLVKQSSNDNFYDLFRDRIIFPIHDEKGNVVAFSGRVYKEGDNTAKYINSPQTKVFTKSNILYNLHNAINEIKKEERIVLFEGYMDVIAAFRAGVKSGVASMGTSLTREQVRLMKRYTDNVTICYDGDPAGIEATLRAIDLFQKEQLTVKIVTLPDRMDPDDYVNQYGNDALKTYIDSNWQDTFEYTYSRSKETIDFTKMLDIEKFKVQIFTMIKASPRSVIEHYIKLLSSDTNISIESLRQDFNQYARRDINTEKRVFKQRNEMETKYIFAERRMVNYLIYKEEYKIKYRKELGSIFFIQDEVRELLEIIEELWFDESQKEKSNLEHKPEEEPVNIIKDEFLSKLTEAQKEFFYGKCVHRDLDLSEKEFNDLVKALHEYKKNLQVNKFELEISSTDDIEEKIRLAKYRDLKIKEDKHGQR